VKGGELTGPNPTDRAKRGSKYHLLVDAHGLPLNVLVSAANRHDSLFVKPIPDRMPATTRGGRGHPRRRPLKLHGDKGYDNPRSAATCAAAGSPPASRGSDVTPAPASAAIAGSSSARWVGCCPTNAWPCATTAAPPRSPR
jgi:hypothetical protein